MSGVAISLVVYGLYLLANGAGLLFLPDLALSIVGIAPSTDVWIRVVGLLGAEIGFYFVYAGFKGVSSFYTATVIGRIAIALVFCALAILSIGPIQLLLFAAIDFLSAIWTYIAARKETMSSQIAEHR